MDMSGQTGHGISGREISSVYAIPLASHGIYVTVSLRAVRKRPVRRGDVIVSMAGKTVETVRDLDTIKESYKPGDTVTVVVDRNGRKVSLSLTFSEEK